MKKERRSFDREFKEMIVELYRSGKSAVEIAEEYDIGKDSVFRWNRLHKAGKTFTGNGRADMTDEQREILRLKKALREAELERDILKKAVNIFSKSDNKSFGS